MDEPPEKEIDEKLPADFTPGNVSSMILSPIHEEILKLAQEMMEKHYVFHRDELRKNCIRYLKTRGRFEIDVAIDELIRSRILVDGKAVTGINILENDVRDNIYSLIRRCPGLNASQIAKTIDINLTTVKWHLRKLLTFRFIRSNSIEERRTYYDFTSDDDHDTTYYILNKSKMVDIIYSLDKNGPCTSSALQTQLELPKSSISRKINELLYHNIIIVSEKPETTSQAALFMLNPAIRDIVVEFVKNNI